MLQLTSGTTVHNRYDVKSQLGAGGEYRVYAAIDASTHADVALKLSHDKRKAKKLDVHDVVSPYLPHVLACRDYQGHELLVEKWLNGDNLNTLFLQVGQSLQPHPYPLMAMLSDGLPMERTERVEMPEGRIVVRTYWRFTFPGNQGVWTCEHHLNTCKVSTDHPSDRAYA